MTTGSFSPGETAAVFDTDRTEVLVTGEDSAPHRPETNGVAEGSDAPSRTSASRTGLEIRETDGGVCGWEGALIATIRAKGFVWGTERAYRDWAGRFVRFVAPRPVEAVTETEVGAFLTALAVRHRSSRSTQKQALNAVGFFVREVLRRPLKQISFERAAPCLKVTPALKCEEIERVQRHLDGPTRLMAELAFGAGLRPRELIRLRVRDVNLRRLQLEVVSADGIPDRRAAVPLRLVGQLEALLGRLRQLHALDRAAGLPGVWLPAAVAAMNPCAGESFEWQWLFPSRDLAIDPRTGRKRRHHLTDTAFECAIRAAGARARIARPVTPHVLWHSCATHFADPEPASAR